MSDLVRPTPSRFLPTLLIAVGCFLALFWHFGHVSLSRLIAQDEGFYVLAAKLVRAGKIPYLDFFYPQMPLQPYLYALGMELFGWTWGGARLFSALLIASAGTILFIYLRRVSSIWIALAVLFLFATSRLVFTQATTAKTYALSILLLLAAFVLLETQGNDARARVRVLFGGLLLGLAVSVRAPLAVLFPVALLHRLLADRGATEARRLWLPLVLGFGFACLPALVLWMADARLFWFNNMEYHLLRAGGDEDGGAADSRVLVAGALFGLRATSAHAQFLFPLFFYAALGYGLLCCVRRKLPNQALSWGGALVVVNVLPDPVYLQYFVVAVPFLLICVGLLVHETGAGRRWIQALAMAALVGLSVRHLPEDLERYTESGQGVIGISSETVDSWRLSSMTAVGREIEKRAPSGAAVLALWPGYLLETEKMPMSGFENHFALKFTQVHPLAPDSRRRLRLADSADVERVIRERRAALVVIQEEASRPWTRMLKRSGYEKTASVSGIAIYEAP